jgi:hypothetical protein
MRPVRTLAAGALLALSCSGPSDPAIDLSGTWSFSYSAVSAQGCPQVPGLRQGCQGGGQLLITRSGVSVSGTYSHRSGCQTCSGASDFAATDQPLQGARLRGRTFEFAIRDCRFTGQVTAPERPVLGTVACLPDPGSQEARGTWTMTRT